jgi:hypothetical protein
MSPPLHGNREGGGQVSQEDAESAEEWSSGLPVLGVLL